MKSSNELQDFEGAINFLVKNTGFPTFDEFKANPDKWREKSEELFDCIDESTQMKRKQLMKQRYSWRDQYECDSLEQLQRIMLGEGYTMDECEMQPCVRLINGTSDNEIEIMVKLWPKVELQAMGGIVANA